MGGPSYLRVDPGPFTGDVLELTVLYPYKATLALDHDLGGQAANYAKPG
jgi:hypothetical protein